MVYTLGYIDINRRFSALHGSGGIENAASSSYLRDSFADSTLGWDELLKERLVVVWANPEAARAGSFGGGASRSRRPGSLRS